MGRSLKKKGVILVGVLWIVMLMTAIAAMVGQTSRLDFKTSVASADLVRCQWACRAGVETALAVLNEDERFSDCLSDLWSDNDMDFNDVELEGCTFSVQVIDEAGRLNVNVATKEQLMVLPYMEEETADAILDWLDRNDEPRSQGAESGYYEKLPYPYSVRNSGVKTIRELLRVKGMTTEFLYGEDTNLNGWLDYNERDGQLSPPDDNGDDYLDEGWIAYLTCYSYENNVDADGNRRVNINQADASTLEQQLGIRAAQARWIVENRDDGFESIADLIDEDSAEQAGDEFGDGEETQPIDRQTFIQIADKITVTSDSQIPGRININTAPLEVLMALFHEDVQSEQIAQAIISERSSRMYGFESIAELLSVSSVTLERFKEIADRIAVRSDVYTIHCTATANISGAKLQTECVADRSINPGAILYWYQGANYQ
jgi:type II secretory pathway component PulK